MRAFALDEFGAAGFIHELPDPTPGEGQVLVRIHAAAVNPADAGMASGAWKDFMATTFPLIPGYDLAGVVEAVGPGVDGFKVGDPVFGAHGKMGAGEGTFAERTVATVASIARRSETFDPTFAGALPLVGSSALQMLDAASPAAGDVIVVIGATGGIGSVAVPLLRAAGAIAIAVTRAANHAYARHLGAAETIDYETQDVAAAVREAHPDGVAAIFDMSGNRDLVATLAEQVRNGGHVVSMAGAANADALAPRRSTATNIRTQTTTEKLDRIAALVADGTIPRPEIRTFALADAGNALTEAAARHTRGKLVVLP